MMTFADKSAPEISFVKSTPLNNDGLIAQTAVITVFDDKKLPKETKKHDSENGGLIQHQLGVNSRFKGENGQILTVTFPADAPYTRMVILGLGSKSKATAESLETAGGKLAAALSASGTENAILLGADEHRSKTKNPILSVLDGLVLGSYNFNDYKTVEKAKKTSPLKHLSVITSAVKTWEKDYEQHAAVTKSVFLTRDLVNCPPNMLHPESYAELIKKTLTPLGVKVQILDEKALTKLGAGSMLSVGQAATHLPRLVIMSWEGAGNAKQKALKPLGFVGKGITFDSGGLNVKPFEGMKDMKMDMGGSATVVGLMHALASRKCKVPVVAAVALAENAISDEATRPSDIVTSLSGKTIEILNTDAEGRLVLCDALTYIQTKHDPSMIVDLATLTGAIMIALGDQHAGVFANDDKLWKGLEKAASVTGEKVWRMPLDPTFRRMMDSDFADIKNIGGRLAGSCTAAAFLEEFIDEGRPWAHIDIAGTAMSKTTATCPVPFASGYGVKLLNKLVEDQYE